MNHITSVHFSLMQVQEDNAAKNLLVLQKKKNRKRSTVMNYEMVLWFT